MFLPPLPFPGDNRHLGSVCLLLMYRYMFTHPYPQRQQTLSKCMFASDVRCLFNPPPKETRDYRHSTDFDLLNSMITLFISIYSSPKNIRHKFAYGTCTLGCKQGFFYTLIVFLSCDTFTSLESLSNINNVFKIENRSTRL